MGDNYTESETAKQFTKDLTKTLDDIKERREKENDQGKTIIYRNGLKITVELDDLSRRGTAVETPVGTVYLK